MGTKGIGSATIEQLAMPLSCFAEPLEMVPAGNLVLVTGPDQLIFKSGTLLDESLPSDSGLAMAPQLRPLVRVSVRPKRAEDLPRLVAALRQLSASDPAARCRAEEWGEHVISGLGELHLSTCIREVAAELAEEAGRSWVLARAAESVYRALPAARAMPKNVHSGWPYGNSKGWARKLVLQRLRHTFLLAVLDPPGLPNVTGRG